MPYEVTRRFEAALCEYTGAPFAVAVNSGTAALLLACQAFPGRTTVTVPARTYCSVPMAVIRAGHRVTMPEIAWRGAYRLDPLPVWDCARRFTSGMYRAGQVQCLSFATTKILGIEQGGAILHDGSPALDRWFRRMRFDGRTEGVDPHAETFDLIGHHCIMLPSIAAQLLLKLHHLPRHNPDMGEHDYPDLSKQPAFR